MCLDKKRLLLISNMYPSLDDPFYGIFVKNFEDNFQNTNIEIISKSVISGKGKNKVSKVIKYLKFYLSIINNIFKFNYDVIYIHYPPYTILPILLCLLFIKKPIILNFHGTDILGNSKIAKIFQFMSFPLIKKAKIVVSPSNYFKQIIMNKFNIKNEKFFVSPSAGIDTSIFKPNCQLKNKALFTLGYVGRIDSGKGWNIFLEVVNKLKISIPNLNCLIVGDGKEVNQMKKLILDLNISNIVSYIGSVPHSELSKTYNKLDLFIFPTTLNESLGLVGIEALSCSIPVIASKIGGIQDYVVEGENGFLFEVNNKDELCDKIINLHNNQEILQNLKNKANKSVFKYDKNIVSKDMLNMLNKVINEKN